MIKRIPKKIKIIIALSAVIIMGLIFYLALRSKKVNQPTAPVNLEITNSTPANGANSVGVADPILITFNQPTDYLTITVTSDPSEEWSISQASPSSVKIAHKLYLRVATNYTLTILQHGNPVGKLVFKTANEQNDPRFLQNIQTENGKKYPLLSLTPYETLDYKVVYTAPLTLEIELKNNNVTSQDAITQVQSWVKSNGIDPSTHKYTVTSPSPAP